MGRALYQGSTVYDIVLVKEKYPNLGHTDLGITQQYQIKLCNIKATDRTLEHIQYISVARFFIHNNK